MELSCKNSGRKLNRWCLAWVLNTPPLNISDNTKILSHFSRSVTFDIETSHLFCRAKQMTGFYIKYNTELKWVKPQWCSPPVMRLHAHNFINPHLLLITSITSVYYLFFPMFSRLLKGIQALKKRLITLGLITFAIISWFIFVISYFSKMFTCNGHTIKHEKQNSKTRRSRQRLNESINLFQQNFIKIKHLPGYISARNC